MSKSPSPSPSPKAQAIAETAKNLNVSESTVYKNIRLHGSLDSAIAFMEYKRRAKKDKTMKTGSVRYPFLMTKLWRLALNIADI